MRCLRRCCGRLLWLRLCGVRLGLGIRLRLLRFLG